MKRVGERHGTRNRGFTLVEVMVALTLSAIGSAVIYSVFFSSRNSYFDTRQIAEVQSDSRAVIGLLAQDLRSAGSNPREVGAVQRLPFAGTDQVRVQSDADGSGFINAVGEPAEDVTWIFDPNTETITRNTPAGAATLLTDVISLQFSYLDVNGNLLGPLPLTPVNRDLVRAINVQLSLRIMDDAPRTWNTILALRNDP